MCFIIEIVKGLPEVRKYKQVSKRCETNPLRNFKHGNTGWFLNVNLYSFKKNFIMTANCSIIPGFTISIGSHTICNIPKGGTKYLCVYRTYIINGKGAEKLGLRSIIRILILDTIPLLFKAITSSHMTIFSMAFI